MERSTEKKMLLETVRCNLWLNNGYNIQLLLKYLYNLNAISFSNNDMKNGEYLLIFLIFTGAYGTVYKARDLNDPSKYVALKKVRIPLNEDGVPVSILREISLVRQLERFQHPNVVRFLDICHGPREGLGGAMLTLFLVFEYVEMDLTKYISVAGVDELTFTKIKVNMS